MYSSALCGIPEKGASSGSWTTATPPYGQQACCPVVEDSG
jgi:hypothetical protein